MTRSQQITAAENAAQNPEIITTDAGLSSASEIWNKCNILAVDTEFIREKTYYAILGLIQISDGKTVWLVDPLGINDFEPLIAMLTNPEILKLLHAPSEDLDVLKNTLGCLPEPMFDLQLAASSLGQPLQISYQRLIEWQLDIHIDKGESRSNWLQRPLTDSQLHYAAQDVNYLPLVYQQVKTELETSKRYQWVVEDSQLQLEKARQILDMDSLYFRFRSAWRLKPIPQKVLQELCRWRELEAEKRNLPRTFILRDNDLMAIAQTLPDSLETLTECTDAHPRALQRHAQKVLELVDNIQSDQNSEIIGQAPPLPLHGEEKKCLNSIRGILANTAAELGIESSILMSKRELEDLLQKRPVTDLPARFSGWRNHYLSPIVETINQLSRTS